MGGGIEWGLNRASEKVAIGSVGVLIDGMTFIVKFFHFRLNFDYFIVFLNVSV